MRKTFAIAILTVMLANSAGFYIYYVMQMRQIKKTMRSLLASMPADQFEVLTLTIADYTASKVDDHEIRISGKMYDVARIRVYGDSVTVFCVRDEREENLITWFDELLSTPLNNASIPAAFANVITLFFIQPTFEFEAPCMTESAVLQTSYDFSIITSFHIIDPPPPEA